MITTLHRARRLKSEKPVRQPYEQKGQRRHASSRRPTMTDYRPIPGSRKYPSPGKGSCWWGA